MLMWRNQGGVLDLQTCRIVGSDPAMCASAKKGVGCGVGAKAFPF